ncbi:hypothetical protein roselon_00721 [Roseibacterium elongatum DSM 19469]|uniref:Transglutaminase-like domain-containing protein n=1 Tax=Roseicyclus elongatus DSM 19469 TaxID=1294273 RepID=W8S315_9RHOB|nr:hypothetical protein roselon_00721 [Roseibacterium elongatum DSM 19469]
MVIAAATGPRGLLRLEGTGDVDDFQLDAALRREGAGTLQGSATLAVSADGCAELVGTLRFDGAAEEAFRARRVTAPVSDSAVTAEEAEIGRAIEQIRALAGEPVTAGLVADQFGGDIDPIFSFLQQSFALLPYAGQLRGVTGTLQSGGGSAADLSALLAAMLAAAGHDVRFATARLSDAQAADLMARVTWPGVAPSDGALVLPRSYAEEVVTLLAGEQEAAELADALRGAPWPDAAASDAAALVAMRDHVWVQVRAADGSWRDLDLTRTEGDADPVWTFAEEVHDAMPERLLHRVEIRLTIEQATATGLTEHAVGGFFVNVPALSDAGMPALSIRIAPLDPLEGAARQWDGTQFDEVAAELEHVLFDQGRNYMPALALSSGDAELGTPFSIAGDPVSRDWRARTAGQTAEALNTGFDRLSEILTTPDLAPAAQPGTAISGVRIDYTILAPGMAPARHTRWIVDHLGPALRATGSATRAALPEDVDRRNRLAFLADTDILITGGPLSEADLARRRADEIEAMLPYLGRAAALRAGTGTATFAELGALHFYPETLFALALDHEALAQSLSAGLHRPLVQQSAHVMTLRTEGLDGPVLPGRYRCLVDLVHVPRVPLGPGQSDPEAERLAQLRLGMVLTARESRAALHRAERLCNRACDPVEDGQGEADAIAGLLATGGYRLLTEPGQVSGGDDLSLALHETLAGGDWVLVSDAQPAAPAAWVRIDPHSGSSLGMTTDGGEGQAEYVIITMMILTVPTSHTVTGIAYYIGLEQDNPLVQISEFLSTGNPENWVSPYETGGGEFFVDPEEWQERLEAGTAVSGNTAGAPPGDAETGFWNTVGNLHDDLAYGDLRLIEWMVRRAVDGPRPGFTSREAFSEILEEAIGDRVVVPPRPVPDVPPPVISRPYARGGEILDNPGAYGAGRDPSIRDLDAAIRDFDPGAPHPAQRE